MASCATAEGRKMSKSLGNSPDPIDLIDVYGADALRCSLVMLTPTGQDIFFSEASLEVGRNFCNKIFQATKLVLGHWDEAGLPADAPAGVTPDPAPLELSAGRGWDDAPAAAFAGAWRDVFGGELPAALGDDDLALEDRWMLGRLCATAAECNEHYERRRLNDASYAAFNFFRHELCDWYLEAIKPRLRDPAQRPAAVLAAVLALGVSYKLLHPVMPFITEELWSWLPPSRGFLMVSPYPVSRGEAPFAAAQAAFAQVMEITGVLRNLRSELGVAPGRRGRAVLRVARPEDVAPLRGAAAARIALLAKLEQVEVVQGGADPRPAGAGVAGQVEVFLPMEGLVDIARERERLAKELAKVEGWIGGCRAKLGNEKFVASAPAPVVQQQRDLLAENESTAEKLRERLAGLSG